MNLPFSVRVPISEATTLAPTLRTAPSPKRMSLPTEAKFCTDSLTSGGSTVMPNLPAVGQVDGRLVLVVAHRGEQPGHVLGRIVGLEVGGPVGHQPVAGGVRLVERVVGERQHGVPQRLDGRRREPVGLHAFGEALELLLEHLALLLAHRLAQDVGAGQRVAGHLLRDAHDLLLVDDQPVGLGEDLAQRLLELGVDRFDRLAAVLAVGVVVVGVHAHRPGPVQRQHRDDVLETGGLHAAQQVAHRTAVELEHAQRVPAAQQLEGGRVVQRQRLQVQVDAPVGFDVLDRVADDRQVAQAEEVHLEQADGLARGVVPTGDHRAVLGASPQRDRVDERLGAHDHRAGVHAGVADQSLQTRGRSRRWCGRRGRCRSDRGPRRPPCSARGRGR